MGVVWVMYRHGPAVLQEDPFLVQVDGDEDDEEVMEMEDTEMVKEVGRSSILHWNYRNLAHLPQELLDHGGHIQEIYLKENRIEKLPDNLASNLPCLTHLYLSKNNLISLPSDFGLLNQLTCLDVSRNHLTCLPASFTRLSSLHSLDLSKDQFVEFPACLTSLPSLRFLSLTGNRLHHLPNYLDRLEASLEGLYLANNCITNLPTCLANCLLLRELYLDHNPLTHLPASLTSLPNLSILTLTHTLISSLPALPSPSCLRIQAEHCPCLFCVPYLTGAQQTLVTMCQQAGWAQAAGLQENTERGVWRLRVWGGGWCTGTSPTTPKTPFLKLPSGELVGLPRGLSYSLVSRGWVSSLKEFCLRQLHSLLPSSLSLSVATTPGLALHLVSVHRPPKSGSPPGFPPGINPPGPPNLKLNHPPSTAALHCLGLTASLVSLLSAGSSPVHPPTDSY